MFFALIYYLGTLSIEGSVVNITSIELISDGNLTLSNSTIFFQNSSIISNGCINITNSNITIDVSNKKVGEEYLILKSTIGCLNYSSSLSLKHPAISNNETHGKTLCCHYLKGWCANQVGPKSQILEQRYLVLVRNCKAYCK